MFRERGRQMVCIKKKMGGIQFLIGLGWFSEKGPPKWRVFGPSDMLHYLNVIECQECWCSIWRCLYLYDVTSTCMIWTRNPMYPTLDMRMKSNWWGQLWWLKLGANFRQGRLWKEKDKLKGWIFHKKYTFGTWLLLTWIRLNRFTYSEKHSNHIPLTHCGSTFESNVATKSPILLIILAMSKRHCTK